MSGLLQKVEKMIWTMGNTIQIVLSLIGILLQWSLITKYRTKKMMIVGLLIAMTFIIVGHIVAINW